MIKIGFIFIFYDQIYYLRLAIPKIIIVVLEKINILCKNLCNLGFIFNVELLLIFSKYLNYIKEFEDSNRCTSTIPVGLSCKIIKKQPWNNDDKNVGPTQNVLSWGVENFNVNKQFICANIFQGKILIWFFSVTKLVIFNVKRKFLRIGWGNICCILECRIIQNGSKICKF